MLYYVLPASKPDRVKEGFAAIDIQLPISSANIAEICLDSRYPPSGFALNTKSEMVVRVLEGSVIFSAEGEEVELPQGSTLLVQTNRRYYWLPKGWVRLLVFSSPSWTAEQHQHIPE